MENQLEFYKSIVDDAVDAIFINDANGNLVLVNKSSELLTGYNKKELLTKNIASLFSLDISKQKPLNYTTLNFNKVLTVENEIIRKDGSKVTVEIKAKKLPNGNYQSFIRDISKRKQIEKERNLINERYKLLFENFPTGIVIENKEGTIIDANPFIHKVFGYNNGELIGKHISEIATSEVAKNVNKNIGKIISGEKLSHTVKSKKSDGTEIYNRLYETKINLPDFGEGILNISHDITKQVEAEQKLKESETKLRNIIEHSSNLFYIHNTEHKLTYVSPQARYFLDCEPEEAMVKWTNFITDNPINKLGFEKKQKAIETGKSQEPYELELITKKGRILTVEVHESPVVENGKTINIVGALIDITERRILESSYKELFDYAPIPIAEEDVTELFEFFNDLKDRGIKNLRKYLQENPNEINNTITKIKSVKLNYAALKLYGLNSLEEYKNNFKTIFTQKSLDVFIEQLVLFFNGSSTFSAETEGKMLTGEIKNFIMKIQLKPYDVYGRKIQLFSLIDITEKKLAERELKKSKEQLQFAIEGSDVGVWDWNFKLGKTTFNTKWAEILGYSNDELESVSNDQFLTFIHPEDKEAAFKLLKKHLKGEIPTYVNEIRMKHKSDGWKWILTRGKVVEWDKNHNPVRMVGTNLDITERKRNEQQIYYQAHLLDSANDAIIATSNVKINENFINKITFWNKGAENLFGWKKEEALGENIRELISLEFINSTFDNLQQSITDKGFWSGDTIQYDKYGNKKYIHLSVSPIKEQGKIIGTIEVNHDITEKIITENAIKENEAKINSIMRGAPIGIGVVKDRILEYVNDQLLSMLGYSREEMIGKNSKLFYESIAEYEKIGKLYEELQSKEIAADEAKVVRKTGDIIEVNITLSPIDKNDLAKGLIFSVLDITEKKKNERIIIEERTRYKNLFNNSPIPLWEEDFTDLLNRLNKLKKEGVTDLEAYLDSNPAILNELISLLKIIDVNKAALHLYKAKTKDELYNGLEQLFTENSLKVFKQELCAVFNGKKHFTSEAELKVLDGTTKIVDLRLFIDYGNEKNQKGIVLLSTIDISERKKNEEELKKWANVFKYSKWGIVVGEAYKKELGIVNPAFAEMHGYTVEELQGKPIDIVFAEEEREKIPEIINEAYQKGFLSIESVHVKKDGTKFPIFANITTTKDDKGNPLYRIVNIYDITEIKESKKKRKELEISYHDIFDNTNDAIYIQDETGKFLEVNKGVLKMYGYPKEFFIGNTLEFLSAEGKNDLKKISGYIKKAFNNEPQQFEFWGKKKDGTVFPKLVRVEKGSYFGRDVVIAFASDITKIKNAEEAIKKERDQAQKYLDITGVMLGVLDIKGNLKLINKKGCEILCYNENEIINKNWFDFALPPEHIKEVKSVFNKLITGNIKNVEYYETPVITKNGKLKTIAFHDTLLYDADSKITGVLFSGEDITLQKETLKNLKKSRKELSELAQHLQDIREEERNNIAREIHDDLGQSLTALKLDTTILLKKLVNSDKSIIRKLESMKELTDQTIKTVQRISSELRPGILDDLGLAAAIEYETSKFEERTNIKSKLTISPSELDLPDNLKVTVFRLFQETCTNVARHSQATELEIKINIVNSNLIMEIKDNGIGIKKEQINDHKSFGIIGMKERLNNINGKIIFKSGTNKGTTVKIEVPLK